MIDLYRELQSVFSAFPDVLFGITDIGFSDFREEYECALVVAIPHSRRMGISDYSEEAFEALIGEARQRSVGIIDKIADILNREDIHYCIPAPAQKNEEELVAAFSYKFAAVNAGLGWIGKNDVLITKKYGPEVTLHAILIDCELPIGKPETESGCPNGCRLCIDACPYEALTSNLWNTNSKRSDLIDYELCNRKRSLYKQSHGRKHACGLCMAVCPVGR